MAAHHLICQNTVDAVVIKVNQPVQTLHLVLPQCATSDDRGLHLQTVTCPLTTIILIFQKLCILLILVVLAGKPTPLPGKRCIFKSIRVWERNDRKTTRVRAVVLTSLLLGRLLSSQARNAGKPQPASTRTAACCEHGPPAQSRPTLSIKPEVTKALLEITLTQDAYIAS